MNRLFSSAINSIKQNSELMFEQNRREPRRKRGDRNTNMTINKRQRWCEQILEIKRIAEGKWAKMWMVAEGSSDRSCQESPRPARSSKNSAQQESCDGFRCLTQYSPPPPPRTYPWKHPDFYTALKVNPNNGAQSRPNILCVSTRGRFYAYLGKTWEYTEWISMNRLQFLLDEWGKTAIA
jgi:hypothetical protein